MNANKSNTEDIKLLIPDYIMDKLSPEESIIVKNAIEANDELNLLYNELSTTLGFVKDVKFSEPEPQYWTNLLPRIHERIEQKEARRFSFDKIVSYWKILVPVAAVILIAIFYFAFLNKHQEIVKTENNVKDIKTDTIKTENKKELPDEIVKENKTEDIQKPTAKNKKHVLHDNIKRNDVKENQEEEQFTKEDDTNNNDFAVEGFEEESLFNGEAAGFDEDLESDLNSLNNNEQESLIKELTNSDL